MNQMLDKVAGHDLGRLTSPIEDSDAVAGAPLLVALITFKGSAA